MIELPLYPNTDFVFHGIGIFVISIAVSLWIGIKLDSDLIIFAGTFGLGIGMIIFMIVFGQLPTNEYNDQMREIISSAACSELPGIALQRESFKDEVVDEIVLRCLINDSVDSKLIDFVRSGL